MEEPWDELMGPSPDDLKNILRDESQPGEISSSSRSRTTTNRATTSSPPVRVRSSASSVSSSSSSRRKAAPPPSAMFAGSSSGPRTPSPPPPPPPQEAFEPQQVTTSRISSSSKSSSYRKAGLQASGSAVSTAPAVSRVRSGGLAFEDEDNADDDDDSVSVGNFSSDNVSANDAPEAPDAPAGDPDAIRQEALKMLEVAEATDANYSVHRTISGGFTATHRTLGAANTKERRTRSALSGLSFSSRRASASSGNSNSKYPRYRDDIYQDDEDGGAAVISPSSTQEDYEYGDTSGGVVDVAGMERRSLASRPADPPSTVTRSTAASSSSSSRAGGKNWSSRYSVDNTLLAMAGGSKKAASRNNNNNSVLDRMDRNHERTSRNLFGGGRNGGGSGAPKVFGNGFSFRKDHVFGKQKVTIKQPQQNLQTVWMDVDGSSNSNNGSSLPPANPRSKSWQEQLQVKRNQRRTYILAVLVAFCATVTIASIFGTRALGNKDKSSAAAGSNNASDQVDAIPDGSVTFYVTADAPYDLASEEQLQKDLQSLSPTASMLIHLGNLQKADVTLCQSSRYANVAALLRQSPITTFVLPGQEDVNNCPNPAAAFDSWVDSFRFFHRHFQMQSSSLHIMSEADQYENFAVLHQGVLFLGLHLVGGRVPAGGDDDFEDRNEYNYQWVQGMTDKFEEEIRAVVILANARPGEPMNKGLFSDLQEYWSDFDKPVAYVHANSGRTAVGTQLYAPFEGLDHVYGIQVGNSGENPPLRLNVGFGKRPFIVG